MKRSAWSVALVVAAVLAGEVRAEEPKKPERPLVQLALLLDTSGSMGGLIEQAKAQLWKIVNEFIAAKRGGQRPILQVALYHYGSPSLGAGNGYIRQLCPLTDDLDKVSAELFKLRSSGGDEYCGWVIQTATNELNWSARNEDYKAIFIAGNETFAQGKVDYREACKAAVAKGIIVNTIHCDGAADTLWADAARLADGRFMHISQNQTVAQIAAPQDTEIARLGEQLNTTYVAFGAKGAEGLANQKAQDTNAAAAGASTSAGRIQAKGSHNYRNPNWEMVDAVDIADLKIEDIKDEELPEEMRKMNMDERKAFIQAKRDERQKLQSQIQTLSAERDKFIAEARKKEAAGQQDTLGEQVRGAVREQAAKRQFTFE
jgi:hypothetical protein